MIRGRIAGILLVMAAAVGQAQEQPKAGAVPDSGAVIRSETRVVLVDAVVTNKKGEYVHDLTAKDFKVWEDNKEQTIKQLLLRSGRRRSIERSRRITSCSSSTTRPWISAHRRRPARPPRNLSMPTPGPNE